MWNTVEFVFRRLEIMLELIYKKRLKVRSERSSENFQMATYGVGGDISLHLDTYGKPEQPQEELIDFHSGNPWNTPTLIPQYYCYKSGLFDYWLW